ncbi:helix-turn-helix domain-containing protein [Lactiplantibacillus plantarum]
MENKLLVFLEAIQQHNSMTKAAQSLFISQRTLAAQLKVRKLILGPP